MALTLCVRAPVLTAALASPGEGEGEESKLWKPPILPKAVEPGQVPKKPTRNGREEWEGAAGGDLSLAPFPVLWDGVSMFWSWEENPNHARFIGVRRGSCGWRLCCKWPWGAEGQRSDGAVGPRVCCVLDLLQTPGTTTVLAGPSLQPEPTQPHAARGTLALEPQTPVPQGGSGASLTPLPTACLPWARAPAPCRAQRAVSRPGPGGGRGLSWGGDVHRGTPRGPLSLTQFTEGETEAQRAI